MLTKQESVIYAIAKRSQYFDRVKKVVARQS